MQHCSELQRSSGGELKIDAAVLERQVIERILKHLGLRAREQLLQGR